MVGVSCHFLPSPAPTRPLYSRPSVPAVGAPAHRLPVRVRTRIRCCSKPNNSEEECARSDSPSDAKEEESIQSRRRCLACLCAVTLISASGPTFCAPKGFAADMTTKPGIQKAVCRNCGGGGAIICRSFASPWSLSMLLRLPEFHALTLDESDEYTSGADSLTSLRQGQCY